MIMAQVTTELAAALPAEVVRALQLLPGDEIGFEIEGDSVRLTRPEDEEIDLGLTREDLRALIAEGMEGPILSADEVFANVRQHLEERSADSAA